MSFIKEKKEKSSPYGEFGRRLQAGPIIGVRGISVMCPESRERNPVLMAGGRGWGLGGRGC